MASASQLHTDDFSARDLAAIESGTQKIGRYLFEHLDVRRPKVWDRRWWDDRIMAWAMNDEAVKVQLFRFIDVLPMLTTPEAVARHLEEYLDDVQDRLPRRRPFWFGGGHAHVAGTAHLGRRGTPQCAGSCQTIHCRDRCQRSSGCRAPRTPAKRGLSRSTCWAKPWRAMSKPTDGSSPI